MCAWGAPPLPSSLPKQPPSVAIAIAPRTARRMAVARGRQRWTGATATRKGGRARGGDRDGSEEGEEDGGGEWARAVDRGHGYEEERSITLSSRKSATALATPTPCGRAKGSSSASWKRLVCGSAS